MRDQAIEPKRVFLVEDDQSLLSRLDSAIAADPHFVVGWKHSSYESARKDLEHEQPDVLLTDLQLPDGSGADLIRFAHQQKPATQIMVLSVLGDESTVIDAIEAGASGYILKDEDPITITASLKALVEGGAPLSPSVARVILKRLRTGSSKPADECALTIRERDVLSCIARGLSYREAAAQLGISANTVPGHIKAIYRKLNVTSRGSAVYEAIRRKIIDV
jgi:DNA-binding NarL/FixJ family response regulator